MLIHVDSLISVVAIVFATRQCFRPFWYTSMIVSKPVSSEYSNLEANLRRGANMVEITAEDERRRKTRKGGPACGSVVGLGCFCFQCCLVFEHRPTSICGFRHWAIGFVGASILMYWIHSCVLGWCGSFLHSNYCRHRSSPCTNRWP